MHVFLSTSPRCPFIRFFPLIRSGSFFIASLYRALSGSTAYTLQNKDIFENSSCLIFMFIASKTLTIVGINRYHPLNAIVVLYITKVFYGDSYNGLLFTCQQKI